MWEALAQEHKAEVESPGAGAKARTVVPKASLDSENQRDESGQSS